MRFSIFLFILIIFSFSSQAYENREYGNFKYFYKYPRYLIYRNQVDLGDITQFRRALREHAEIDTIILDNDGGRVYEALEISEIIHDKQFNTVILNGCFSACSYLFFAGKKRLILGELGVHQLSTDENLSPRDTLKTAQSSVSDIISVLNKYEVSNKVLEYMLRTSPQDLYIFSKREIELLQLENEATQLHQGLLEDGFLTFYRNEEDLISHPLPPKPRVDTYKKKTPQLTKKDVIKLNQKELNRLNCRAGLVDGIAGSQTLTALSYFLQLNGYKYDKSLIYSLNFNNFLKSSKAQRCWHIFSEYGYLGAWKGRYSRSCNSRQTIIKIEAKGGYKVKVHENVSGLGSGTYYGTLVGNNFYGRFQGITIRAYINEYTHSIQSSNTGGCQVSAEKIR